MGKLLTLASTRDLIEDCVEEQRSARQDLREIRAEQHRRQREEAALRYPLNFNFLHFDHWEKTKAKIISWYLYW